MTPPAPPPSRLTPLPTRRPPTHRFPATFKAARFLARLRLPPPPFLPRPSHSSRGASRANTLSVSSSAADRTGDWLGSGHRRPPVGWMGGGCRRREWTRCGRRSAFLLPSFVAGYTGGHPPSIVYCPTRTFRPPAPLRSLLPFPPCPPANVLQCCVARLLLPGRRRATAERQTAAGEEE